MAKPESVDGTPKMKRKEYEEELRRRKASRAPSSSRIG